MNKIYVDKLKNYLDTEISFSGYVDTIRNKKWVMFVILRDSTGKLQMTIEKSDEANAKLLEIMNSVTVESTIKVTGKLVANEAVKLGGMELIPTDIEVTSLAQNLPFDFNNLDKHSTGLMNTKNRIELIFNGSLSVESNVNIGTKITIKIPKKAGGGLKYEMFSG